MTRPANWPKKKDVQIDDNGVSLQGFVEDNESLLTAIAVLAGLILFSKDLSPSLVGGAISFLLVGAILLLWLEIWFKFPERVTVRLFTFRYLIFWSIIGIIFCWLYRYRVFWDMFLFLPVWVLFFWFEVDLISQLVSIFPITRKWLGIGQSQKNRTQKWIKRIAIGSGLFIAFVAGIWISFGINAVLDIFAYIAAHTQP